MEQEHKKKYKGRRGYDSIEVGADYTDEELEFLKAIDKYRTENNRPFPTFSEILAVLKTLGYNKTIPPNNSSNHQAGINHVDALPHH